MSLQNKLKQDSDIKFYNNGWKISNVFSNGKRRNEFLSNKILKLKDYDEHIEHAKYVGEESPHIVDLPRQHAIFEVLVKNKNNILAREIIDFLRDSIYNNYCCLFNSTIIFYHQNNKDKIVHTLDKIEQQIDIIKDSQKPEIFKEIYFALFGEKDSKEIKKINKEIFGRELNLDCLYKNKLYAQENMEKYFIPLLSPINYIQKCIYFAGSRIGSHSQVGDNLLDSGSSFGIHEVD